MSRSSRSSPARTPSVVILLEEENETETPSQEPQDLSHELALFRGILSILLVDGPLQEKHVPF